MPLLDLLIILCFIFAFGMNWYAAITFFLTTHLNAFNLLAIKISAFFFMNSFHFDLLLRKRFFMPFEFVNLLNFMFSFLFFQLTIIQCSSIELLTFYDTIIFWCKIKEYVANLLIWWYLLPLLGDKTGLFHCHYQQIFSLIFSFFYSSF